MPVYSAEEYQKFLKGEANQIDADSHVVSDTIEDKLDIKAISVNEAYTGRRFATDKLRQFKKDMANLLRGRKIKDAKGKRIKIEYDVGCSNAGFDVHNAIKATTDCISDKYGFNDNQVYLMTIKKTMVPKRAEFIYFKITIL